MASALIHHRRSPIAEAIRQARLIAVLRRIEPRDRLLALVDDLLADGVRIFEITLDAAGAAADLAAVRARIGDAGWVGAGTVRTDAQLRTAADAGAAFGVSPVLDDEILGAALAADLPFLPGAYTPTEVDAAWRAGATFVKLFPGSSLGPSHVRELRGPMPEIETVVTGGLDHENAAAYLDAGAVAIGIGSALQRMSGLERRRLVEQCRTIGIAR
ncbi:MAG: bifunctional 4-hydroxy-2-oxoglutarate aldolase/2-dehydro-3-deoxy-phosphogluconate aldolase [Chloroflexota bacterium]|nr:bifunctional 4-hydroxy-2-oxoglutarate aldolase/2-dehydro-3-deoxy-phosphogluconate aldolase [Chloroflexota bacterium]